ALSSASVLPAVQAPGGAGSTALKTANRQPNPNGVRFGHRDWIFALLLVVMTILAYQPVWHAGFIWDDNDYVTNNLTLRSLNGLLLIWFEPGATAQYYPLTFTTFWLEYHLWGLNPLG